MVPAKYFGSGISEFRPTLPWLVRSECRFQTRSTEALPGLPLLRRAAAAAVLGAGDRGGGVEPEATASLSELSFGATTGVRDRP